MAKKSKAIYKWTKKIHMYAGLLTFSAFVVWGITGVHAVFLPEPGAFTPPPISSVREVPFQAAGDMDDKALAKAIFEKVDIPLAGGRYNVHRDENLNLAFNVFTINGGRVVTFLEDQGIARVEHRANDVLGYLSSMHTASSRRHRLSAAANAWGYYNELSTWAFLFMTISGVYLWIASRPGMRWAQISFWSMAGVTAALWIVIR
ncbi:MAG: PepSY domain-containing protein [Bryobacterales bacterium]|nr:PepSY domain-containing protein [Bryobacterales bacterium]